MKETQQNLRDCARELLSGGEVNTVIGYARGSEAGRATPVFVTKPGDCEKLIWNPLCVNNLAKYLLNQRGASSRAAVVVKGCDSRSVIRLLQDNQINRDGVLILGVPCPGLLDPETIAGRLRPDDEILETVITSDGLYEVKTKHGSYSFGREDRLTKCRYCEDPDPVVADHILGDPRRAHDIKHETDDRVTAMEELGILERNDFWDKQFSRCLRCYSCRNVCPGCSCAKCVFDQTPGWLHKSNNLSENTAFHLIRAFHLAGRCVDCGECSRVCPVDIPLHLLNKKILKDIKDLYNAPTPGKDLQSQSVLGSFSTMDPEEFM